MPSKPLRSAAVSPSFEHFCRARTIKISIRQWLIVGVTLGAILTTPPAVEAGSLPEYDRVRILDTGRPIADAELTDHNGQPIQLSSLQGRVTLVMFGFTHCPDVCPLGMELLRQLSESGQVDPAEVAYVMISVDGERDTPAIMKKYVQRFSPQFIGLTGDRARVKPIAKNFSVAFFKGNPTGDNGEYSVAHSTQIFAIDPAGRLRAEFFNPSVEAMAGITQALLDEAQNSSEQANAL
jgi:protein SCO1/2